MKTKRTKSTLEQVAVATAVLAAMLLPAALATAQDTGAGRYAPDKTQADYEQGVESDGFDYSAITLRSNIWLDKAEDDVYRRNDRQEVSFEVNEDAYAVVYRIDSEGAVSVLWPRSRLDDGFVFGGHRYDLPVGGGKALRVGEREGEGFVAAIFSRYPFDLRALELDFFHEGGQRHGFVVAGDPYLAMNEVNYAVTGLEDAGDYVVTNHARYYVHRQVDHPRYLCGQCHVEDEVAYDPYDDHCTLTITYDHHWSNSWYDSYGYYPVYWNPVYAYYDPWTYRPWVNFWYRPWYRCAPYYGWRTSFWGCYTWYDSPYYHGDVWVHYDNGHRRYKPLSRYAAGSTVARKTREYTSVTSVVDRTGPTSRQRTAMKDRSPVRTERDVAVTRGGADLRGERPVARTRTKLEVRERSRTTPGLTIRNSAAPNARRAPSGDTTVSRKRHTAAGGGRAATLAPVQRSPQVRTGESTRRPSTSVRDNARTEKPRDGAGVRTVEPRQRGSRVWNSQRTEPRRDSGVSKGTTRSGGSRGNDRAVSPRSPRTQRPSGATPKVQPRTGSPTRRDAPAPRTVKPRSERKQETRAPRSSVGSSRRSDSGSKSGGTSSRSSNNSSRSSSRKDRGGSSGRR